MSIVNDDKEKSMIEGLPQRYEIGVSYRYVQEYDWIVQAITGFLSAYYMENPGFRVHRRIYELETGMNVWICEAPNEKFIQKLLRRLQVDIPAFHLVERIPKVGGAPRKIIDLPERESQTL